MISAVVLAAGKAERFRANKLLFPVNDETILENVVKNLLKSKVDEIIVVVGFYARELREKLIRSTVKIVYNPKYEEGMSSSFIEGLRNVDRRSKATLLVLGDQPFISSRIIDEIIKVYQERRPLIVSPVYGGKKGHPVLFDRVLYDEIINLGKNQVIRDVIHRHIDSMALVKADKWTAKDVDTWEEYIELIKQRT